MSGAILAVSGAWLERPHLSPGHDTCEVHRESGAM